jgi:hypothetical protein
MRPRYSRLYLESRRKTVRLIDDAPHSLAQRSDQLICQISFPDGFRARVAIIAGMYLESGLPGRMSS